jgi:hypothetical protein
MAVVPAAVVLNVSNTDRAAASSDLENEVDRLVAIGAQT